MVREDKLIQVTEKDDALIFTVRVMPRASKSEIIGEHDGALKIRLAAPPVNGAANEELIKTLARFFDVARRSVELISGATSKTKQVRIVGASAEKLKQI